MSKEIDHERTDSLVCPYCGYVDHDSWELLGYGSAEGDDECYECGKSFTWWVNTEIYWHTEKKEVPNA